MKRNNLRKHTTAGRTSGPLLSEKSPLAVFHLKYNIEKAKLYRQNRSVTTNCEMAVRLLVASGERWKKQRVGVTVEG